MSTTRTSEAREKQKSLRETISVRYEQLYYLKNRGFWLPPTEDELRKVNEKLRKAWAEYDENLISQAKENK